MAESSNTTPREQLCRLGYSELTELAARLTESAETVRNPAVYADLHQAAVAVSDLASIKFAVEEIAGKLLDDAFAKQDGTHDANPALYTFATDTLAVATELLAAIGKSVTSE